MDFTERQEGKLGLNINMLMRESMIGEGIPYDLAAKAANRFATAFDNLTGTEWVEINGTTEWKKSFDCRPTEAPMTVDERKAAHIDSGCPCGKRHARQRGERTKDSE